MFESPPPPDFPRPKLKTAITTGWSWPRIVRAGNHRDSFGPNSYVPARSPPHDYAHRDTVPMNTAVHSKYVPPFMGSDGSSSAPASTCSDCDDGARMISPHRSQADVIQPAADIMHEIEEAICGQTLRSPSRKSLGDAVPRTSESLKATSTEGSTRAVEFALGSSGVAKMPPQQIPEQASETFPAFKDSSEEDIGFNGVNAAIYTTNDGKRVIEITCTSPTQSERQILEAERTSSEEARSKDKHNVLVLDDHCDHESDASLEAGNFPAEERDNSESHATAIVHEVSPSKETTAEEDHSHACVHDGISSERKLDQGAAQAGSGLLSRAECDPDNRAQFANHASNHLAGHSPESCQGSNIEERLEDGSKIPSAEVHGDLFGDQIVACRQHQGPEPLLPPKIIVHKASEASTCTESWNEVDAHPTTDVAPAQDIQTGAHNLQDPGCNPSSRPCSLILPSGRNGKEQFRSGNTDATRSKILIRKTRNILARRPVLKIALGRQIAGPTKEALRRRAHGNSI